MPLRTDDRKSTGFDDPFAQFDVRPAPCHVRGNRDGAFLAGIQDDFSFVGMVLGVQDRMLDAFFRQIGGNNFRRLDRYGTDKDRLPFFMALDDVFRNRLVLAFGRRVNQIDAVVTDDRLICRNRDDVHIIDIAELFFFRFRRTGHAGQFLVFAEIVLERDCRHRHRFILDFEAFLGFDRLMEPVRIAAAFHEAAGELVDDDHFAVLDNVIDIFLHRNMRFQRLIDRVVQADVAQIE